MPTLSAKFELHISAPCLIEWPEGRPPPEVRITARGSNVLVRLLPTAQGLRPALDRDWVRGVEAIELMVTRDEEAPPPATVVMPNGSRDSIDQQNYLRERLPAYRKTARDVVNRVLRFFQYRLHTPLVRPISPWEQALHNPIWYDDALVELPARMFTVIFQPMLGSDGALDVRNLTPNDLAAFEQHMAQPERPSLPEELLSDAQSAWYEDNLRRAVLELAICVEILVKRKFFAESTPAGAAFDYLEDKSKISVRVLDLLDGVAKQAFSHSYKEDALEQYQRIDYLFRCRNKIAHRGELSFRDDGATLVHVDKATIVLWWQATNHLTTWFNSLQ